LRELFRDRRRGGFGLELFELDGRREENAEKGERRAREGREAALQDNKAEQVEGRSRVERE
jgi:hypothetical protein